MRPSSGGQQLLRMHRKIARRPAENRITVDNVEYASPKPRINGVDLAEVLGIALNERKVQSTAARRAWPSG